MTLPDPHGQNAEGDTINYFYTKICKLSNSKLKWVLLLRDEGIIVAYLAKTQMGMPTCGQHLEKNERNWLNDIVCTHKPLYWIHMGLFTCNGV